MNSSNPERTVTTPLYGVLLLTEFALQAVLRLEPLPAETPCALIDPAQRPPLLLEVNAAARGRQLLPGLTVPRAQARCAGLRVLRRSTSAESLAKQLLLEAGWKLTPDVEWTAPGVATLDFSGLPGDWDWQSSLNDIVRLLSDQGLRLQAGLGGTPQLALYAARHAGPVRRLAPQEATGFLGKLALREADPSPEQATILAGWGLRTLGDLTDLPPGEIARRLGHAGVHLWERAAGGAPRPLDLVRPADRHALEHALALPAETLPPLLFVLRRLLSQLCLRLKSRGLAAGQIHLCLRLETPEGREEPSSWECQLTPPNPTDDPEILMRQLQTRLESVRTDFPISAVQLELQAQSRSQMQIGLLDAHLRDPERFAETLAVLTAMAGEDRIGRPMQEDSHRPDAFRLVKPDSPPAAESDASDDPAAGRTSLPLRRFRPALRLAVRCTPSGQPEALEHPLASGVVTSCRGPWRSSGGWWERGRAWERVEWDVELACGGLYRVACDGGDWQLEGSYG